MTREDIIQKVKALDFPDGSYIVFGSCPMALVGIREAGDIDMLVTDELLEKLRNKGWKEVDKGGNDKPLASDIYEAHNNWNFSSYQPTLKHLLATAIISDGVPFAALEEVRKWKLSSGRPKDLVDVALIDDYLEKNKQ